MKFDGELSAAVRAASCESLAGPRGALRNDSWKAGRWP
jgi:hypothetical protein